MKTFFRFLVDLLNCETEEEKKVKKACDYFDNVNKEQKECV